MKNGFTSYVIKMRVLQRVSRRHARGKKIDGEREQLFDMLHSK